MQVLEQLRGTVEARRHLFGHVHEDFARIALTPRG
jgi:hypothetical protein